MGTTLSSLQCTVDLSRAFLRLKLRANALRFPALWMISELSGGKPPAGKGVNLRIIVKNDMARTFELSYYNLF